MIKIIINIIVFLFLLVGVSFAQDASVSNNFYNKELNKDYILSTAKEVKKKYKELFRNSPIKDICGCTCSAGEMYYYFGKDPIIALVWKENNLADYTTKLIADIADLDFLFKQYEVNNNEVLIFTSKAEKNTSANIVIVSNKEYNQHVVSLIYNYQAVNERVGFLEKYAASFNFSNAAATSSEVTAALLD